MTLLEQVSNRIPSGFIRFLSRLQWQSTLLRRAIDLASLPLRRRDATIQRGTGRGLRFNAGGSHPGYILGTTEPELQQAFERLIEPGTAFCDVGASVGFHAVLAAKLVGPSGAVYAFEPVAENVKLVRHNMALNGFTHFECLEMALSDEDGKANFNFSSSRTLGRLASVGKPPPGLAETELVTVARLDKLVEARGFRVPSVIKIDVEGAELGVLKGSEAILRSAKPICFIDLHGTNVEVADYLESLGYEAWVLNSAEGNDVRTAPWWVCIVAVPKARTAAVRAALG